MITGFQEILIPFFGFLVNILIQILSFRYVKLALLKSVFLGFSAGFFIIIISGLKSSLFILIANLIIYSAFASFYFNFISLGETARRVRILKELYDCRRGLSLEEILQRYSAEEIIERRIARLISNNQIIYKDAKFYISFPVMTYIVKLISLIRMIVFGRRGAADYV